MAKPKNSNLAHLEWLVESRSENQRVSLFLYKLLKNYETPIRNDKDFMNIAQGLVAAVFSLWRAVFLSDVTTEGHVAMLDHAEVFLEAVINDDAIGYQQDKRALNWTFQYYVNNASYRLREMAGLHPHILPKAKATRQLRPSEVSWTYWHDAAQLAIRNFEAALKKD